MSRTLVRERIDALIRRGWIREASGGSFAGASSPLTDPPSQDTPSVSVSESSSQPLEPSDTQTTDNTGKGSTEGSGEEEALGEEDVWLHDHVDECVRQAELTVKSAREAEKEVHHAATEEAPVGEEIS